MTERFRVLVIASRPSDLVELADLSRELARRGHIVKLLYFFERLDPGHLTVFKTLEAIRAEGIAVVAVDHETVEPEPVTPADTNKPVAAPVPASESGSMLGGLRGVALWLRRHGLHFYPRNSRVTRLAYELARDFDGVRDTDRWDHTKRLHKTLRNRLSDVPWLQRFDAMRRIHQAAAMVMHYLAFRQFFRATIDRDAIQAILIPEDIVGKLWPVAIAAGHESGIPTLVLPYTLANRDEAVQSLKHDHIFQTNNNRLAARLYPRWRHQADGVDIVRLPSPHIFAHEDLGIAPPDPWMMNSGDADRVLVDSRASFEYFRAGGIPAERMVIVGSVSQDRMHRLRQERDEALRTLRGELGLAGTKPLVLISGCPNQLTATVPFCEFRTIEEIARFVGESVAPLAEHYDLVVRPHPNFIEFGSMLAPFGVITTTAPTSSLVPLADVFIAFASATIRWAIACAIPTVNYDVFHYGYGDFAAAKGVASVSGSAEFRDVVRALVPTSPKYQSLANQSRHDSAEWSVMDGKSIERIEQEIHDARSRRVKTAKEQQHA